VSAIGPFNQFWAFQLGQTESKRMKHIWMLWIITLCAIAAAAVHFVWPQTAIDGVTVTLLLVAVVPWLQPLFKSIELPGGVKVEFQDLQKVTERAEAAGLLATPPSADRRREYSFLQVASSDPNLALAGLRIELERRLDLLARSRAYTEIPRSIGQMLRFLNERELINGAERSVPSELVGLLNSAVHGADVDPEAAQWALDIGPRILEALQERASLSEVRYQGIVPGP
jgi:hypothetical protein